MRVLTGRAGSGKTRVALELCEEVQKDWDAGFVRDLELRRFLGAQNLSTWGWQRPALVVIDYAASHAVPLCGWLGELADYSGPATERLRLLLLERQADAGAGWWQTVFAPGGFGERGIERLLDPAKPIALQPIADADERRRIVERVLTQKASTSGDVDSQALSDRQLLDLTWGGEPLFLMMAAMMAADIGMAHVLSLGRTDLAFELAERELRRVATFAGQDRNRQTLVKHLAAYATLCRGLDRERAEAAAAQERDAIGRGSAGDPAELIDLLATALAGGEDRIEPILPDMIGEAAILKAFEPLAGRSADLVRRAFAQAGQPVAATIIRTAQDFAGAGHQAPLAWLDVLIDRDGVDLDQLMLLADTLPRTSSALLEHAVRLTERVTDQLRDAVTKGDRHRLPALARYLSNLGVRLSAVGQRQAALAPAQEAVAIRRALAASAPDAYRPDLAMALNNLAVFLSEVGQRQAALAPAQEAADLYRALAASAPDAYRPDLAMALNNLAIRLSEVGQRQAALAPAQEAADLYRALAASAPDAYRPDLASALNNLAIRLSEVGQRQAALAPAQQAADLYRELAASAPDAYRPDLAAALNNLAKSLSEVGQRQAALAPAQEAVAIRRELAASAPDAYRPALRFGPQQPGQLLERGRPAPGGARAGAGGGRHPPRAGGERARCLSARPGVVALGAGGPVRGTGSR